MKKLFRNTFHFAYANFEKSFRAAYATFPPPSFRLRMTYASLARPCAHQGFQRLFLMPYAEACAPLAQPFRPRCLSSNFSTELTHSLRGACAFLTPLRRKNENAYAMLARCLRDLSARHVFEMCSNILLTREFRKSPCRCHAYALLTPCLCFAYAGRVCKNTFNWSHI